MDGGAMDQRTTDQGTTDRLQLRRDFAAFLRARRERIDPRELGLPLVGQRRTPGLRREEVAQLAGLSVDYYTRLEQGRDLQPSAAVVEGLARALQLGPAERDHLFRLGRMEPAPRREHHPEVVRPSLVRILEALAPNPAFVSNRRMDVLAWNRPFATVAVDFGALPRGRRNLSRLVFLDPRARDVYPDWEAVAMENVGFLRGSCGRYPDDAGLLALIADLRAGSADFERLWDRQDVREKTSGSKQFAHPALGRFTLDYDCASVPGTDQNLILYSAPDGSSAQATIELLAGVRPRPWG
jgi:transcriptional regulator with XRE-family HTH domain